MYIYVFLKEDHIFDWVLLKYIFYHEKSSYC
jgi:hypothetical protein